MLAFLLFLVLVYIVIGIIGFVVKGLFWLFVIAAVAFALTLFFGGNRFGRKRVGRKQT